MSKLDEAKSLLPSALRSIQTNIRWRKGSASNHLRKRIDLGHLPESATIDEYSNIIHSVVNNEIAEVYLYQFKQTFYPTVVAVINSKTWLVMFTLEGVMETSFIIEHPHTYLSDPSFNRVGNLGEVLHE